METEVLASAPRPVADLKEIWLKTKGTPDQRREALRQATRDFEAIFIQQMIAAMRQTVGEGGLLRKSLGEKIFESMLDEEWAKKLAGRGGPRSLSELLYQQLSRQLGATGEPDSSASLTEANRLQVGEGDRHE